MTDSADVDLRQAFETLRRSARLLILVPSLGIVAAVTWWLLAPDRFEASALLTAYPVLIQPAQLQDQAPYVAIPPPPPSFDVIRAVAMHPAAVRDAARLLATDEATSVRETELVQALEVRNVGAPGTGGSVTAQLRIVHSDPATAAAWASAWATATTSLLRDTRTRQYAETLSALDAYVNEDAAFPEDVATYTEAGLQLGHAMSAASVRIIQPAVVPIEPIPRGGIRIVAFAAVAGLLLAALLAFLREAVRPKT